VMGVTGDVVRCHAARRCDDEGGASGAGWLPLAWFVSRRTLSALDLVQL
jgi:hypothetical protein